MVKKKEIIYGIILTFVVILFLWLVSAIVTSQPNIRVISPANFTNNSGTITFNVTYANVSVGIIDPRNVTFYYNLSANSASIQNSSGFVLNGSCFGLSNACFVTLTNTRYNLSDGTYTLNASLDNGTDQVSVSLTANLSINVIIDNTPPIVFNGNITNPVTETNYSGTLLLNVSVADALAGVRAVVFNITNETSGQNATRIATQIGVIFFNYTINTPGFPDGLYNVSILANDTTTGGNLNNTARIQLIRFDNTPPIVFNSNISGGAAGTNLSGSNKSGTFIFNVSIVDVTSGIRTVMINISNSTGNQNVTSIATKEGTTNSYSLTINTAAFPDGVYNLTVFANDTTTGGNLNNTARATRVVFDNTPPTVSVSCVPSTVQSGAAITCTCTKSDATSGVNTVSFDANPSTSSTGTFTSSCTVTDFAGNSATGSVNYIVEGSGSGSSSSSGGGSTTTSEGEKSIKFAKIVPETPAIVKNLNPDYGLKEISISVNTIANDVKITVTKFASAPPTVTTQQGRVYKYLQIEQEKLDGKLSSSTITIRVEKSWINANGLTKESIIISKFINGAWSELPISYKEEDANYYYYTTTVNSFSFFAISEKVKAQAAVAPRPAPQQPQLGPSTSVASSVWFWLIVVLVIIIVVVWWFVSKKRHY